MHGDWYAHTEKATGKYGRSNVHDDHRANCDVEEFILPRIGVHFDQRRIVHEEYPDDHQRANHADVQPDFVAVECVED